MEKAGAGGDFDGGEERSAEEPVVSLAEVLAENEELEKEARAVLGGSDHERCSYSQVGAWAWSPGGAWFLWAWLFVLDGEWLRGWQGVASRWGRGFLVGAWLRWRRCCFVGLGVALFSW